MVGHFVSTKEKSLWIPHVKIVCCDVALKQKNILKKLKNGSFVTPNLTLWFIHDNSFHYCHGLKEKEGPINFFQQEERSFKGDGRSRPTKEEERRKNIWTDTYTNTEHHTNTQDKNNGTPQKDILKHILKLLYLILY